MHLSSLLLGTYIDQNRVVISYNMQNIYFKSAWSNSALVFQTRDLPELNTEYFITLLTSSLKASANYELVMVFALYTHHHMSTSTEHELVIAESPAGLLHYWPSYQN